MVEERERKNLTPTLPPRVLPAHFVPSSLSECLKQASVALMCFFSPSPSPLFALAPQARLIPRLDLVHLKPRWSPVRVRTRRFYIRKNRALCTVYYFFFRVVKQCNFISDIPASHG